ncbi:ABC transporter transmembrane domain-containing protein [Ahrensia sp. R2A130]|uniref:ABC transporter transmembrane domain-containing protein n=1 Tax=Ahrensia sp. R2A130 TaxID=744979 RepID=UPI0001E0CA3D|nr:ABC transporter transmembrane domain-containing protein [Ahrensia sp. R2A130]EFL87887.1 ABC transporter, permease/ATP-binding protein [Ahrensia sp. R2A130]
MSEETQKDRTGLAPLRHLVPYIMRYRGHLLGALVFLFIAALTTLSLPLAVRSMIDNGFLNEDAVFVNQYFYALFAIAALLAISSSLRYYFVIWLGERVVADLRSDVFAHITTLSADFFDTARTGELVSRLTADTTQIKSAAGATASMALRNVVLIIGAIAGMIWSSPSLSLIVLAAIPLIVLPIFAFGRNVRKKSRFAQDELANATAFASESISSVKTLQAFTNETLTSTRFSDAIESSFSAARSSVAARATLTAFAIFMIFTSVIGVLWIGAGAVLEGTMTPGLLGQFLIFSVMAAGALGALSEVWGELSQAAGAAERLSELLATEPVIAVPTNPEALPEPARGELIFDHVAFAYPTRMDDPVVKDLSLAIKAGETVAVVGSSGAGKSTLFNLVLRYYDPTAGNITLDGVDIAHADPAALRNRIALVPQDTVIFATTARENIRFGRPDASDADVEKAAKLALAHDFISGMADGYDTTVGERGITLSGGQRQRMAIARAILKDAPLLLLDEATSALDAESEKLVQKALDGLMVDRTTVVIAHRLATVLKADRIVVMDAGTIVEEGTHAELVKRGGIYARLAKLQFETDFASVA